MSDTILSPRDTTGIKTSYFSAGTKILVGGEKQEGNKAYNILEGAKH